MFTGIIHDVGKIISIKDVQETQQITIQYQNLTEIKMGDSISVNGTCLTVVDLNDQDFSVDVMPETYERTNLYQLKNGDAVNLEQSLKLSDRLDGHIVLGHIDTTVQLLDRVENQNAFILTFSLPIKYQKYVVEKGSVALNGISLTVISVENNKFVVGIIPHTLEETNLGEVKLLDLVNLEVDILSRYVVDSKLGDNYAK